jgi:selenocysteine-specific elongation factor
MEIIVGTAGHIDHGKTALVRALTGTDADRLPEEKERGITIDIGFAELDMGDAHFGFVDVPGHERFVKNMLAGASGIDLVMLVIAADEGVMPQTREHFEICRLLALTQGIVVLTKSDLVDDETLELAKLEAAELVAGSFLEDAPVVAVSSVKGAGINELKTRLSDCAAGVSVRNRDRVTFLPIDRSFTVKGFGAVVTGTLASGGITEGSELELLPEGRRVRVRGVQTHGRSVESAVSGQRTAVNLGGIDHGELSRGMVLSKPGVLRPTQIFDSHLEILGDASWPLRSRQRVRLHIGTAEVLARVSVIDKTGEIASGSKGFVQFRLESPVASFLGERFIVRSYSPQATIGGGQVLIPNAEKIKRKEIVPRSKFLSSVLTSANDSAAIALMIVESHGEKGCSIADLRSMTAWRDKIAREAIDVGIGSGSVVDCAGRFISSALVTKLIERTLTAVEAFHKREPLAAGMTREELRERAFKYLPVSTYNYLLKLLETDGKLSADKDSIRLAGHQTELSPVERIVSDEFINVYREARFEPPKLDEVLAKTDSVAMPEAKKLFQMLVKSGQIVKVTDEFYFSSPAISELRSAIKQHADAVPDRSIDVAGFKQIAGVSRKYAIPLLEYFDREKVTVRVGDKRVVLK